MVSCLYFIKMEKNHNDVLWTNSLLQKSQKFISAHIKIVCCYLEIFTDLELSKLDEKLIQILAWQRLQQLMPSKTATEGQRKATLNGLLTTPGKVLVNALS